MKRIVEDNFTDCYKNVFSLLFRFQLCLGLAHVFPVADLFVIKAVFIGSFGSLDCHSRMMSLPH